MDPNAQTQALDDPGQTAPEKMFADIADERDAKRLLEALLFSSKDPLTADDLSDALPDHFDVQALLSDLAKDYDARGIVLENNGPYWAFRTASDLAERLTIERIETKKLSRAGLETLSIIAYHQPVTRAEIEDIRGVAVAKGTVDSLLELGWIRPRGRKRAPGRPLMWGTTDDFLDHFGLTELGDLPGVKELKDSGMLDRAPSLQELEDDTFDDEEGDESEEGAAVDGDANTSTNTDVDAEGAEEVGRVDASASNGDDERIGPEETEGSNVIPFASN